jgi:hypothetical protein
VPEAGVGGVGQLRVGALPVPDLAAGVPGVAQDGCHGAEGPRGPGAVRNVRLVQCAGDPRPAVPGQPLGEHPRHHVRRAGVGLEAVRAAAPGGVCLVRVRSRIGEPVPVGGPSAGGAPTRAPGSGRCRRTPPRWSRARGPGPAPAPAAAPGMSPAPASPPSRPGRRTRTAPRGAAAALRRVLSAHASKPTADGLPTAAGSVSPVVMTPLVPPFQTKLIGNQAHPEPGASYLPQNTGETPRDQVRAAVRRRDAGGGDARSRSASAVPG